MFRTATDPMHAVDMQDFHAAHRRRNNSFNPDPPAPGFTPGAGLPLLDGSTALCCYSAKPLQKRAARLRVRSPFSRHCLPIIAVPNELNETVIPDVQALCLDAG